MQENLKDINIGQGLGDLKFGASREQVKELLGKPTDIEKYTLSELDNDETEAWHYDDLDLSLSFDAENDYKLSSIAVSSEDYLFKGQPLVGKSREDVLSELDKHDLGEIEEDEEVSDENPENALLHVDEASMSLWFENDVLSEVQIGPFYKNDQLQWPS